ncbi:MAG: hypothetical protein ACXVEE_23120 [Polyangiales bacterium]
MSVYESWTVLPHDPVQKLGDNLWHVTALMANGRTQRQMTLARMSDGRVVVHNAIALQDDSMKELEAWGKPSFLVVPNGFHRQDAKIWKQRYPDIKVIAPAGSRAKVSKVVTVEGAYDDVTGDADVKLVHLEGTKAREGVMIVRSGNESTIVFNDAILNMPKLGGLPGFFLGPTGQLSIPRFAHWMLVSDKRAFRGHLERLSKHEGLSRIIVGHGRTLKEQAGETLGAVAAGLG